MSKAANKYMGEAPLVLDGKTHSVVFDYAAIAEAQEKLGTEALVKIGVLGSLAVREMCELAAIGLKKHHPNVTADDLMRLSPPIAHMRKACDDALTYAFFGAEALRPEKKEGAKKEAKDKDAKKKTS